MKYRNIAILLVCIILCFSCSKEDTVSNKTTTSTSNLKEVATFKNDHHLLKIYSETENLLAGYNLISIKITDLQGNDIAVSNVRWNPLMTMNMNGHSHQHSCPFSPLTSELQLHKGHIIFTMSGQWSINIEYTFENKNYTAQGNVSVKNPSKNNKYVHSKNGYVLGLVQPKSPTNGTNDMIVALYKMDMQTHLYNMVSHHTIAIDPRMPDPSMGNHSSPNNTPLTQKENQLYYGKVNFTMSGHWRINIVLKDENQNVVLGEAVSEENPSSSVYFDIEF